MTVGDSIRSSTRKLPFAVNQVAIWTNKWRIERFSNDTQLPYANRAKYFGMTLDAKLPWKKHIKKISDTKMFP